MLSAISGTEFDVNNVKNRRPTKLSLELLARAKTKVNQVLAGVEKMEGVDGSLPTPLVLAGIGKSQ